MIAKQLTGKGHMWTHCLQTFTYACNSFAHPVFNRLRPIQLTYGRLSIPYFTPNFFTEN